MNKYDKIAEDIYTEIVSLKACGDNLESIEKSEEMLRKRRIAHIRIAIMNHDNELKTAIFNHVYAFLLGFLGSRAKDIKISIRSSIARTFSEDYNE